LVRSKAFLMAFLMVTESVFGRVLERVRKWAAWKVVSMVQLLAVLRVASSVVNCSIIKVRVRVEGKG
jgi:hypothetical protein